MVLGVGAASHQALSGDQEEVKYHRTTRSEQALEVL